MQNNAHSTKRWTSNARALFTFSETQFLLSALLLSVALPLFAYTVGNALFNTVITLLLVTIVGIAICKQTARVLGDPKLDLLATFWLTKLGLTLFLLYAGWIPQLDPSSGNWGYDPQRYYIDAAELLASDWSPETGSN